MRGEYYPNIAELSEDEVAKQAPFGAKWRLLAQVEVRCYILISNISGSVKVAPLQILQFPVILPHKFQDAEKFNLQFSDFSEITETADKLRWLRYQKGLRQRDVADLVFEEEIIPITETPEQQAPPPPEAPKVAELLEIVDDKAEIDETTTIINEDNAAPVEVKYVPEIGRAHV